jgi:GH15 family glucan-1,4-alpha-glucosidase
LPDNVRQPFPLQQYAAIGDGRSIAILDPDGTAVWWCAPNLDSPALFDNLLDPNDGGYLCLQPAEAFHVERRYRQDSNVFEATFTTANGVLRLTDAMNSSLAGRLPWCEFARRIEVLSGVVRVKGRLVFGTRAETVSPWIQQNDNGAIFHVGPVLGMLRTTPNLIAIETSDRFVAFEGTLRAGQHGLVAVICGEAQPLGIPSTEAIEERIDLGDKAWRTWAKGLRYQGPHREHLVRSALALKLLLFSPSGAIAAAGTTSLPERLGEDRNYDYRYAWVRDAVYTLDAFLRLEQIPEAQASLAWLIARLNEQGIRVCYTLDGNIVPAVEKINLPGYENSRPVVIGNAAGEQHQHGVYGDIFQAASLFVEAGSVLDQNSASVLSRIADECADRWRQPDSGIWELEDLQHYTMSKISCWQALFRAVQLAEKGHLPSVRIGRWSRERDRIEAWVNEHCWSEGKQAFTFYPGSDRLDASLTLAAYFGFPHAERLSLTCSAIQKELQHGPWVYRYTGAEKHEGAFLSCTFWLAIALDKVGRRDEATRLMDEAVAALPQEVGILSEMIDVETGNALGNLPQGLSHLALIHALLSIYPQPVRSETDS